jgi:hypothetical protein
VFLLINETGDIIVPFKICQQKKKLFQLGQLLGPNKLPGGPGLFELSTRRSKLDGLIKCRKLNARS